MIIKIKLHETTETNQAKQNNEIKPEQRIKKWKED